MVRLWMIACISVLGCGDHKEELRIKPRAKAPAPASMGEDMLAPMSGNAAESGGDDRSVVPHPSFPPASAASWSATASSTTSAA